MSPELERLLNALWERDHCEPKDREKWNANVERMIADAMAKVQGISREEFLAAIRERYDQFCRARKKHTTLPPQA